MKTRRLRVLVIWLGVTLVVLIASAKLAQEATTVEIYHLTTHWYFKAPIEQVWHELVDGDEQWKQAVGRGDETIGVGTVAYNEVKGELPYTLRFTTKITRFEPPFICEAKSTGDLVGSGKWVLEPRDEGTAATFYWDVGMSNPILNLLSKIPFVRDAMVQNHDQVMEEDYRHTVARLEGAPD